MPKTILEELLRKQVVVRANGILYRGILLEVSPTDITLKRETGYTSIPMDRITAVNAPGKKQKKGPARFIDKSFYEDSTTD